MEHKKPVRVIEDTEFIVNIDRLQLEEKANPYNIILFSNMKETENGYEFEYCRYDKNIPHFFHSDNSVTVHLPPLKELDPEGMARRYDLSVDDLKRKTDFEIMVDQAAYHKRVVMGMLPTFDIRGHHFFVDIRMDMLRPKDDFLSKGIVFSEVEGYYLEESEKYLIPYNPKTHEFQAPVYDAITEFPKDLIAVEIPLERYLDPIGWNRMYGLGQNTDLKWLDLKSHHTAVIVPWKDTFLSPIVEANLRREQRQKPKEDQPSLKPKRKGRGM
ncbi:hypothetical protein [Chryseobacterium sp. 22543]|uniref:hypothetical protein n=1 Tax=Chryseobacterium sp. 22543 TaxID=3453940 RepID=UPI003F86D532